MMEACKKYDGLTRRQKSPEVRHSPSLPHLLKIAGAVPEVT